MKDHRQVYLIGNPVVWWSSTIAVGIYIALRAVLVLREKRGFKDLYQRESTGCVAMEVDSELTVSSKDRILR